MSPDRSDEGGYRAVTEVMSNKDLRKQLLKQAEKELRTWEQKFKNLVELTEIFDKARNVFDTLKETFTGTLLEALDPKQKRTDEIFHLTPKELETDNSKLRDSLNALEKRNRCLEKTIEDLEEYIGQRLKERRKLKQTV